MSRLPSSYLFVLALIGILGAVAGLLLGRLDGAYYVSTIGAIIGGHAVAHVIQTRTTTTTTSTPEKS